MPNMTQPSDSESDDDTERPEGRLAHPNAFIGAATTSLPLDPTAHNQSLTRDPSLGDKRLRDGALVSQPLDSDAPESSAGNATHTVLLPKGAGDRVDSEGACSRKHYRRKMFASIADTFGRAEEFIWFHFQLMTKRSMQGGGTSRCPSFVPCHVPEVRVSCVGVKNGKIKERSTFATWLLGAYHGRKSVWC